jgi:23S rRNA pseudouridine1911/1915/1917 synthase
LALKDQKKKQIKNYLRFGSVRVNGAVTTRHDRVLRPKDEVSIETDKRKAAAASRKYPFKIIYEDDQMIVIDKPAGLLTIATDKENEKTAYRELTDYVRSNDPSGEGRVFIVHRIDRETSGLIVFAKTAAAKRSLQDNWKSVEKRYFAVTEGTPEKKSGEVTGYLNENRSHQVFSGYRNEASKYAATKYRVLASGDKYALVEVTLDTGRKHQIRVHMSELGHPVAGDKRYGAKTDPAGRMALHASYISLTHPVTRKRAVFKSELPASLFKIMKMNDKSYIINDHG